MSAVIDAPGLSGAVSYWNGVAGRTLYAQSGGSTMVTVRNGDAICGAASACSAPVSAIDHQWHPDMSYPYEHCDVYVRTGYMGDPYVIAHELGHCLGFAHVTDWLSIMSPTPHPNPSPDRQLLVSAGYV